MSHQRLSTSVSVDFVTCLVGRDAGAWLETSAGENLLWAIHLRMNTPQLGRRRRSYKGSGERSRRGMPLICGGGPDGGGVSEFELACALLHFFMSSFGPLSVGWWIVSLFQLSLYSLFCSHCLLLHHPFASLPPRCNNIAPLSCVPIISDQSCIRGWRRLVSSDV